MANVNTQELFEQKAAAFGASATSTAFQNAFMLGLKLVMADLRNRAFVTASTPSNWSGTISLDEDYYLPVLSAGLDYYIQNHGDWMRKPEGNLFALYADQIKTANLYYLRDVNDTDEARLGDLSD